LGNEVIIQNMTRRNKFNYKGVSVNIVGLPTLKDSKKENHGSRQKYLYSFSSNFEKDAPKNLLIIYDISEGRKKDRDWFRRQLKNFDFVMIQRSVWVGPSPLPADFTDYLKRVGLQNDFKTFKLAKPYKN
jgi:DNA-binding transcriptional regulator PaaX